VYVSFSGGKDSTVLADLVAKVCKRYGYKMYLLFVNTGLEYPEIQKFVKTFAEWLRNTYSIDVQLDIVRPEMRFDEVIKKYGYPVISKETSLKISETRSCPNGYASQSFDPNSSKIQRYGTRFNLSKYRYLIEAPFGISHKCCDVMKKKPSKKYEKETGRKAIIGTLASESKARQTVWEKYGCNAFNKGRPTSWPMSFWTEQDVLHYIKKYDVPYCPVYGDIHVKPPSNAEEGQINIIDYLGCYDPEDILETTGCDRTGCIFCMFGCHLEKEPNRFQRLKETHPRQYEYCIGGGAMVDGKWQPTKEGLGLGKVLDYIGVKYE
jgi:3'-phosphoadenosine 5'-phosphosulfate sulfotransferase (PAPS reductase)/FAD synthetase